MCGPDGFVDSSRHQNRFRVKGDKKEQRGKNKTSKSFTVVDLAAIKERDQKEYEKRFKLIDVSCFFLVCIHCYFSCLVKYMSMMSVVHEMDLFLKNVFV